MKKEKTDKGFILWRLIKYSYNRLLRIKRSIKNYILPKGKYSYKNLFKIKATPHNIAQGFSIGVVVGLLPGAGWVIALLIAFIFRLNKPATIIGALMTNLWTLPIVYVLSYEIGRFLTTLKGPSSFDEFLSLRNLPLSEIFKAILSFLIGLSVFSITLGFITYTTSFVVIHAIQKQRDKKNQNANIPG